MADGNITVEVSTEAAQEPVSTAAAMRDARLNAGWGSPQEQAEPAESPCACWPGRTCNRRAECAADVRAHGIE